MKIAPFEILIGSPGNGLYPCWIMGSGDGDQPKRKGRFPETQWSLVFEAGQDSKAARAAFERLCMIYWYPLYGFARDLGYSHHDAEDHTQALFENLIHKKNFLANAQPERGRFRNYILTALRNHISKRQSHANTLRRGGTLDIIPFDGDLAKTWYSTELTTTESPEKLYDRRWAQTLLTRVRILLGREYAQRGKTKIFEAFIDYIPLNHREQPYEKIANELNIEVVSARVEVYRMRKRFGELLRTEIEKTVLTPEDVEREIDHLFGSVEG